MKCQPLDVLEELVFLTIKQLKSGECWQAAIGEGRWYHHGDIPLPVAVPKALQSQPDGETILTLLPYGNTKYYIL